MNDETPRRTPKLAAAVAATALVAGGAGAGVFALATNGANGSPASAPSTTRPVSLVAATSTTVAQVHAKDAPGVVEVSVSGSGSSGGGVSPFGGGQTQGVGSGFVLDTAGHIVTAAHVVEGSNTVSVTFADGTKAQATVVGQDPSTDVAVLRVDIPASRLTPLELGSAETLAVGDGVIAIGSPFGLEGTTTAGIVSALDRTIDAPNGYSISGAIQTDAAINPGNSGGPLLDAAGRVVGLNVQIASESGGNEGVGFAVPVETVRQIASRIVAGKSVEHAYLGVSLSTIDATAAAALGLPQGAQIASVQEGSPAASAGLRAGTASQDVNGSPYTTDGDVVTALDGTPIRSAEDLSAAVGSRQPGDRVTLTIVRGGSTESVAVTLGARPS
jgi:S1-C subfamily serine protease